MKIKILTSFFYLFIIIAISLILMKLSIVEKNIRIKNAQFVYKENLTTNLIHTKIQKLTNNVVVIQCFTKNEQWHGTGFFALNNYLITARHVLDKKTPIKCNFIYQGQIVKSNINIKNSDLIKIDSKDIVFYKIQLPNLKYHPVEIKSIKVMKGQPLFLISHPWEFVKDELITFGLVVSTNINRSLPTTKQIIWKNAIMTDMSASPGSSGAPIFNTNGDYIGIHVGGSRSNGLNLNYQLLFDEKVLFIYSHIKDQM